MFVSKSLWHGRFPHRRSGLTSMSGGDREPHLITLPAGSPPIQSAQAVKTERPSAGMWPIANTRPTTGDLHLRNILNAESIYVISQHNDLKDDPGVATLRAGGCDSLATIFQTMQPSLRRMLRLRLGRMGQREDTSDVLQNTYLEASRRLDEYLAAPQVSVNVWLRRLTRQVFIRMWRSHMSTEMRAMDREEGLFRVSFDDSGEALASELSASMPGPASEIIQQEMQDRLQQMIGEMSDSDREILALRHLESLSIRDTADELEISLEAASKRYQRAILKLGQAMGTA